MISFQKMAWLAEKGSFGAEGTWTGQVRTQFDMESSEEGFRPITSQNAQIDEVSVEWT